MRTSARHYAVTRSGGTRNVTLPNLPALAKPSGTLANLWSAAILTAIGAPTNKLNMSYMVGWMSTMEGGGGQNNPLNLESAPLPGAYSVLPGYKVLNFPAPDEGARQTAAFLRDGYPAITSSLKAGQGIPSTPAISNELYAWSGHGYTSITPTSVNATKPIQVGSGPNGGRVRPGGTGTNSPTSTTPTPSGSPDDITTAYDQLLNSDRTAPKGPTDVSFFGGLWNDLKSPFTQGGSFNWALQESGSIWNGFKGAVNAPIQAADAVDDAAGEAGKILRLLPWYFLRFTEFMTGTLFMAIGLYLSSRGGRGVVNEAIQASPIGRFTRIRRATTLGRREGQAEHYRLSARRAARIQEAGKARNQ